MASISGLREVAYIDCAGGGQVRVDGTTAYVGHMAAPYGTSIFDVSDPAIRAVSPKSACRPAVIRTRCGRRTG